MDATADAGVAGAVPYGEEGVVEDDSNGLGLGASSSISGRRDGPTMAAAAAEAGVPGDGPLRERRREVTSHEDDQDEEEEFGFLIRHRQELSDSLSGRFGDADAGRMEQQRRVVVTSSRGVIGSGRDDFWCGLPHGAGAREGAGAGAGAGAVVAHRAAPVGPPSHTGVDDDRRPRIGSASSSSSSVSPIGVGRGGRGTAGGYVGSVRMHGSVDSGSAGPSEGDDGDGNGNGRPRRRPVRRSQSYYDRLMMPTTSSSAVVVVANSSSSGRSGHRPPPPSKEPPKKAPPNLAIARPVEVDVPPPDASSSPESNLVALCRAGHWDQVREWLLLRRRRTEWDRDDDFHHPLAAASSPSARRRRRREVSTCPPPTTGAKSPYVHFAADRHGTTVKGPTCHCDTALSIACGLGRRRRRSTTTPGITRAPMDVIDGLWRYCPDQLGHVTFDVSGEDASTPTVRVYPRASGAPLHHALWAVRWGENGGEDVCSGLDLVECLVDAEVAVNRVTGVAAGRGKTPKDEKEPSPTAAAASSIVGASRLPDHGGRTPLQIWVEHIFPRLMTLGGHQPEVAVAGTAASVAACEEGEAVFRRWVEVLRRLLVAWPCACSVPDASGTTLLMTVLRWESLVPQHQQGGGGGAGAGAGGDDGIGRTTTTTTAPSRALVERRLLEIVRIMLEEEEGESSSSSSSSSGGGGGVRYWSCSSFGCSPLHYAVEYKRSSAVIGAVLDASSTSTSLSATVSSSPSTSSTGSTTRLPLPLRRNNVMEVPLHVAAALRAPLSVMGLLLHRRRGHHGGCFSPADQVTALDRGGRSPLTWAYIRFLEHYDGMKMSRRKKGDAGRGEDPATPADVPRARRRIVPRRLRAMEEAVLGSLRRRAAAKDRKGLLSGLGPFWDVAQLLLVSAYHGGGSTNVTGTASAATTTALADVRSFLGMEASDRLTEQVRGVLSTGDMHGKRWRAVHAAASLCPTCCPRGVLAIATMVHPDQLGERDEGGRLPLHLAIDTWSDGSGNNNDVPWSSSRGDVTAAAAPASATLATGEVASRTCWTHDETGPSAVRTVLSSFRGAAGMTDGPSGRLPLHVAVEGLLPRLRETGPLHRLNEASTSASSSSSHDDDKDESRPTRWMAPSMAPPPPRSTLRARMQPRKYSSAVAATTALIEARLRHDVRRIAMAHPEALGEVDVAREDGTGTGGLLPFMIAAAGPHGSTCLSYELLREGPDVLTRFIPPSQRKDKGESDGGLGGSAASPCILGQLRGSSSPHTSPGRFIEGRGGVHGGDTVHKRARCS